MSDDLDNAQNGKRHVERSRERAPQHESTHAPLGALPASPETIGHQGAFLTFLRAFTFSGRGNGPVRAALVQRMQQTHGNRAARRFLTHISSAQRQVTTEAAPRASLLPVMRQVPEDHTATKWKPSSTGLGKRSEVKTYVKDVKGVARNWASLTTPEKRAEALVGKANDRLTALGVEKCGVEVKVLDTGVLGKFSDRNWNIAIDTNIVSKASMTHEEMSETVQTVLHEARHAEQSFRVARLLAGEGKTSDEIATELDMRGDVAKKAAASPISKEGVEKITDKKARRVAEKELGEAEDWHKDVTGEGRIAHREVIDDYMAKTETYNKKLDERNKSEEHQKRLADLQDLAKQNQDLVDAYEKLRDAPGGIALNDPEKLEKAREAVNKKAAEVDAKKKEVNSESPELQAAREAYEEARGKYRSLPIEKDAYAVGAKVKKKF